MMEYRGEEEDRKGEMGSEHLQYSNQMQPSTIKPSTWNCKGVHGSAVFVICQGVGGWVGGEGRHTFGGSGTMRFSRLTLASARERGGEQHWRKHQRPCLGHKAPPQREIHQLWGGGSRFCGPICASPKLPDFNSSRGTKGGIISWGGDGSGSHGDGSGVGVGASCCYVFNWRSIEMAWGDVCVGGDSERPTAGMGARGATVGCRAGPIIALTFLNSVNVRTISQHNARA